MSIRKPTSFSFIVRIWWERANAEEKSFWRGRVENILSGEVFYFEDFDDLVSFLNRQVNAEIGPGGDKGLANK